MAKDTLKIPTMDEYAIKLIGANVGSKITGSGKGNLIAASKGASTLKKIVKGK
jgi:hypothetical protein